MNIIHEQSFQIRWMHFAMTIWFALWCLKSILGKGLLVPLDPLSDIEMTDQGVYFNYESMQQNDGKIPKPETQKKAFRSVSFNFDKTYDPYQNRGSFPPAGY